MAHIINLSINTATYEILQVIECLRNLLEYDGSRDAPFKFSKWRQRFSFKTIIMNRVMGAKFELQCKAVAELSVVKLFSSYFRRLDCVMVASWVRAGSLRQFGPWRI